MNGKTKRRVGFGALTGLVIAAGLVGVNSMSVSGQTPPEGDPILTPFGTVTINVTDRAGSVVFDPGAPGGGDEIIQQMITVQPCNKVAFVPLQIGGVPVGDLLTFTAKVGGLVNTDLYTVQIPSNAIGVHDGSNCGTPAGLLGPNEQLEIGLGGFFDSDVTAASASLVVGKSHSQDGSLIVAFGTETQTKTVAVGGATLVVQPAVADTFDTIGLSSTANQKSRGLSIKGGTFLNLVVPGDFEAAVFCGETVTQPGTGATATSAQFLRGANLDKPEVTEAPCADVGATVEIIDGVSDCTAGSNRPGCVFFDNQLVGVDGTDQFVSGTLTINWAPIDPTNPVQVDWLNREIDFDAAGPAPFVDVVWCADDDADAPTGAGTDFNVTTPPDVPWCLISDVRSLGSDGKIHQTQVYYGAGDPYNR